MQRDQPILEMFATQQHTLRLCGAHFMGCQQQRVAVRPVAISVWNKNTGAGYQN
jgi:hypothetical protein